MEFAVLAPVPPPPGGTRSEEPEQAKAAIGRMLRAVMRLRMAQSCTPDSTRVHPRCQPESEVGAEPKQPSAEALDAEAMRLPVE